MVAVHVFVTRAQPLTRYVVSVGDKSHTFKTPPRSTRYSCTSCRKRRQARHLVIQVYYDCSVISCAPGKGCHR